MLLWYILSLSGMLNASRRFGYVIRTGLGFPFFQLPSFSCLSMRRRFSSLFSTNDFADGFQETPFLHFIMDSYKLSYSIIFFIFCFFRSFSVLAGSLESRTVSFDYPRYYLGFCQGFRLLVYNLQGNHCYAMTIMLLGRQSGRKYSSSNRSCC